MRDPLHLARLFTSPLETLSAGAGVEAVLVEVLRTEPLPPEQTHVPETQTPGGERLAIAAAAQPTTASIGAPTADRRLADLIDRLGNRLGFDRIVAFRPRPSHLPECAYTAVAAEAGGVSLNWPAAAVRAGVPRPVRLLATPEPIEILAPPVGTADPPSLFRLRGGPHRVTVHRVTAAIGPERIAWAWWRDDPDWRATVRDYWRIEDADGRRLWLFRRLPEPETDMTMEPGRRRRPRRPSGSCTDFLHDAMSSCRSPATSASCAAPRIPEELVAAGGRPRPSRHRHHRPQQPGRRGARPHAPPGPAASG